MSETCGRLVPGDWAHVERYPYAAVAPATVARVERALPLPAYRARYDQGREGACVGFASSWLTSIFNRRFYDARWLWNTAKGIDEWPWTNAGDENGTSVRAAMDVLRTSGHSRIFRGSSRGPDPADGILTNRWATTVDEIRTSIAAGAPVVLGCNWYLNFDAPQLERGRWWIGRGALGHVRSGHAVCIYRASDRMQAVGLVNSWGDRYPLAMLPYETLARLLDEDGEATLVTDRP
jgi:hypothetical protein